MEESWYEFISNVKVGDLVRDDLTSSNCTVIEVHSGGVRLDNDYSDGYRFRWELSQPKGE